MNLNSNSQSSVSTVLTGKGSGRNHSIYYTLPNSGSDSDISKASKRGDFKATKTEMQEKAFR